MPLRKYKKRSAPRRRPVRRARRSTKPRGNTGEYASLSCARTMTIAPPNPGATVTNTMYAFADFKLADFPRAVQVAGAYQHYRISGIKLTFKPAYDSYSSALGADQKPNLYYMIDKADAIPGTVTLEGLKQMGARPRTFDEKPISITWRPSVVLDAEIGAAGTPAAYKVSPWLSTNANAGAPGFWTASRISHKGLKWYMEQPATNRTVYVEVELQFQFKKPVVQVSPSAPQAIKMSYPPLDDSPDGVEGGTDGITQPFPA